MARIEDLPEPLRSVQNVPCPSFEDTPFIQGPPLSKRRVAVVSSAALFRRGEAPFPFGSAEYRTLPASLPFEDILTSHVSIAFDRSGLQRDLNVVYPIHRLRELEADGVIGSVADTHYSILGSTDPDDMADATSRMVADLRRDRIDAVALFPV